MEQFEMTPDRDRTLGDAAAEIVGITPGPEFDALLLAEAGRAQILCREHYTPRVAVLPDARTMAVALVQGMTLAAAIMSTPSGPETASPSSPGESGPTGT
jgi:hypothetical protein